MNRTLILVWGAIVVAAGVIGYINRPPQSRSTILSAQKYPLPDAFPVRIPDSSHPAINAKHALLIDAETFYPLFKKQAYTPVPVASTTKMMTALVVLERFQLDDVVTVSRKAANQIGSTTGLLPGETLTVKSLLKALLIQSGNDAAYALAEHAGSVEKFVGWMNEKAQNLGMRTTVFKDPAGLDDTGISSAFDLAILAREIIKDDRLTEITALPEASITTTDGRRQHLLKNSNRLATEEMYFPGVIGIKTGFTPLAGHTLVAAAERNGRRLISVVLFTYDDTKDASARESFKLLSWGFANHRWQGY